MLLLIWSKNRACQLDALLTSVKKYLTFREIAVLYTHDFNFKEGYDLCNSNHKDVLFKKEKNYREDTIELAGSYSKVCFSTDDMIVFNSVKNMDEISDILTDSPYNVFSFRLGYNTCLQDNKTYALIPERKTEELLFWRPYYYNHWLNYGYPLALDMHAYNRDFIIPLLNKIEFNTANELEGRLQPYTGLVDMLFCPKESVAVNCPLNNMSGLTEVNKVNKLSLEELEKGYLEGKRLSYNTELVHSCHQDLEVKFNKC